MSVHQLPAELLDYVCQHLRPKDLLAISSTATCLYHISQRLLYRHIYIDSTNLACVFILARNPLIARHVRTFAIRLSPFANLLRSFYQLLQSALSNMCELTSLEISVDQSASWILRTRHDSTYFRLRRIVCSFHLDHNLAHFLNKTDNIVELEVDSLDPDQHPLALRHNALPHLTQFTGSSQAAQCVVPGRPVEHIHLNSGDLTEEQAETLANSAARISVLAAATTSHSVSLIGTLTRCMEHLVHLRLVTTYNYTDAPDSMYFANIAEALTSLPDLQSFEIWGLHWRSSNKSLYDHKRVWESETFNSSYLPTNNVFASGSFLDDLYSDISYAY